MALYTYRSQEDMNKMLNAPKYNPRSQEVYNTLTQNASNANDNFFTKRAKSIDNAVGTTGAALYETGGNLIGASIAGLTGGDYTSHRSKLQNDKTENLLANNKERMNDVYKQFGFNGRDDYETQLYAAEDAGNQAEVDRLLNLPGLSDALKGQANANKQVIEQNAADYKDYVENNDASKRINQDQGKFLGSAMNTLSTATDVLGLTNGPLSNAVQGAWEGVADELEQNGLENFSAERAGQNALTGAATGAVTGLVNKGVDNALAKKGGNLFKGGNRLTQGLNNLGSQTALGRGVSTVATGAARGALSGAVGGATGAGVQSALQGTDLGTGIANALQGAARGAQQGVATGAIMSGANMAINKTPFVGDTLRKVGQAQQDWKNSGESFGERLGNTINSGESAVGNTKLGNLVGNKVANVASTLNQGAQDGIANIKNKLVSNIQPDQTVQNTEETPSLAYGESDLGNRTRRGAVADSLERFGETLEGAQTNVTRAAAKDLGIESTGKVIDNVRKKTGITNLETQAKLAKELTGGENSLMDSVQRQALTASKDGQTYKVDTTPIMNEVDAIVDKYADTNMFGSQTARAKFIRNLKTDISNFDSDVLSISNRMKANAADLRGKGVASPAPLDSAKAKIYSEVAGKLDDLSYKAIPSENVDAMFDATISEMRGRAAQASNNGNKDIAKAYNKAADALSNEPRTIKAYRSFKKDFVDASKIADLTAQAENGAAAQMGRSFGSGLKRFTGTILQRPVNAVLAKIGGGVNAIADKISGDNTSPTTTGQTKAEAIANTYDPSTQLYNAIGRTEGAINRDNARTATYLADAVQEANTLEDLATAGISNGSNAVYNAVSSSPATQVFSNQKSYFPATGDYWTDIIGAAMTSAIDANDADAFGALYSMYQDALSKNSNSKDYSNPTNWSATDRSSLLKAQNGLSQIDSLEQSYNNAVGEGSNGIQGTLRQWANNLSFGNADPSAENYVKQANSIGAGIIKNLVNLGSTEYDAERYIDYLPKLTDTKEQASQKLAVLRNAYQDVINNLYSVYNA